MDFLLDQQSNNIGPAANSAAASSKCAAPPPLSASLVKPELQQEKLKPLLCERPKRFLNLQIEFPPGTAAHGASGVAAAVNSLDPALPRVVTVASLSAAAAALPQFNYKQDAAASSSPVCKASVVERKRKIDRITTCSLTEMAAEGVPEANEKATFTF